jgi:hypothetical protein
MTFSQADYEARLDERTAAIAEAEEIFGTFSPEHLAAYAAYNQAAAEWPGPEVVMDPCPCIDCPEPEAEL